MAPLDIDTALDWRGRTVVDRDGEKIGKLEEFYLDESDRPAWGAITTGLFGRRQSFVPLAEIEQDGNDLRVPFDRDRVKDAPNVDPDAQLSGEDEDRLYRHYGVGGGGGDGGDAGDDRTGAVAADAAPREESAAAVEAQPRDEAEPPAEGERARRGEGDGGEGAEMIRSEEEVSIGTRRRATHRARLKKYVVTEHVKQVVPVQREEVRVEYEPAGGGEATTEGDAPVRGERPSEDEARMGKDSAAGDVASGDADARVHGGGARAERDAPVGGESTVERGAPVRDESTAEREPTAEGAARGAGTEPDRGGDPGPGLSAGERDRQVVAGGGPEDLAADRAFESDDMAREDRVRDRREG